MTRENENLILQILKKIQNEQANSRDNMNSLLNRMGNVESELANIHSEMANLHGILADQSIRMDRFSDRVGRIEQRLEIID